MSQLNPIQVNYVREFIKLSLWYAHKRLRENQGDFEDLINSRVNIYRNTSLYDGQHHPSKGHLDPAWTEIHEQLRAIFNRHQNTTSTSQLEDEGLNLLWPYLEARLLQGGDPPPLWKDRPYRCWRFDAKTDRIHIHIFNLYQPSSPLSEMRIPFAAALIRLLHDAQAQNPQAETVCCGSWLNSVPTFQALFPKSWIQSVTPRGDVRYTMGTWGQFTDRRGDFHTRNGTQFRKTGAFPYPSLACQCPIGEAITRLETTFPDAVEYNKIRIQVP